MKSCDRSDIAVLGTVLPHFLFSGEVVRAERFGSGLINDTFLCEFREAGDIRKYIVQRINAAVFRHPEQVMENIERVTSHIAGRLCAEGAPDPSGIAPALVKTRSGNSFLRDEAGDSWRVYRFIEAGTVYDSVRDAAHAYEVGRGLGRFQALVADLPPESLRDTLPGFHMTPKYLAEYDIAVQKDLHKRAARVSAETAFVKERRALATVLTDLIDSKAVPLRVVHNDPKVNNVMVHTATGKALCMLDLDTVKAGIVHFDFGDCARSAANPAGEDAVDVNRVVFSLDLFEAVSRGYLQEARSFLLPKEIEMLPVSVQVITFELGIRFLADYLRGDTYFRICYPSHNLHRARVQFKLLESIEAVAGRMSAVVS